MAWATRSIFSVSAVIELARFAAFAFLLTIAGLAPTDTAKALELFCYDNDDNDFDTFEDCEDPDCYGFFGATDSGQALGNFRSTAVALTDVDGDGDLDAFVANEQEEPDRVWLNDGGLQGGTPGSYTDSGQALGSFRSTSVALADVDGDGDPDAFVGTVPPGTGAAGQANLVWLNNGSGTYTDSGQKLGSSWTQAVALGDLDGDGDLDAFVGNGVAGVTGADNSNRVWLNDGSGSYSDSGQILGASNSVSVALADLDNDNDLDVFVANYGEPNRVWLNDGSGIFADTRQVLGNALSAFVVLSDLDGDNDLDAFVANGGFALTGEPNHIWLNDGAGNFTDSGQVLGTSRSASVALKDIDGDGDIDAFVGNDYSEPNLLYLNDGIGNFSDNTQILGNSESLGVALGDLDGDGEMDAFVANYGWPNRVWEFSTLCPAPLEECFNTIDDDGDTLIDCDDPDCQGFLGMSSNGQALGNTQTRSVALADLDGDGDLDAFEANSLDTGGADLALIANRVWLNDGAGTYTDSGQELGVSLSWSAALGDLDGDGDIDAFVGNFASADNVNPGPYGPNRVFLNDGSGTYVDSGQMLGTAQTTSVDLGDVDGDGDLDAFVGNMDCCGGSPVGPSDRVWLNDGSGVFSDSGQVLGLAWSHSVSLGDIDGDMDLDALVVQATRLLIWINDGSGTYSDSGQLLAMNDGMQAQLADLDGDNDLDLFVVSGGSQQAPEVPNQVWFNDGAGTFVDSGQTLGNTFSWSVALGDLDGDGDLDAFVGNDVGQYIPPPGGQDRIWLNDGNGSFTDSGEALGASLSRSVALGDLDGDGTLDAFVGSHDYPTMVPANRVYLNDCCPPSAVALPALSPSAYGVAMLFLVMSGAFLLDRRRQAK